MRANLKQLAESIQAVEERCSLKGSGSARTFLKTGWDRIDDELGGGLARCAIHEWFSVAWGPRNSTTSKPHVGGQRGRWLPPLTIMLHLARCAMAQASESSQLIVWIGRRCWPSAAAMRNVQTSKRQNVQTNGINASFALDVWTFGLLDVCLFIDPPDDASRLWAIDLALRSPAVAAVIADGSNLDMAHTRRLQLAAAPGNGGSAIGLLARPSWELDTLSAARTRWKVSVKGTQAGTEQGTQAQRHEGTKGTRSETHSVSSSLHAFAPFSRESSTSEGLDVFPSVPSCLRASVPSSLDVSMFRRFDVSSRWRIELLRCKGMRPASGRAGAGAGNSGGGGGGAWTVEVHRGAESGIHLSADVADRSDPAAAA